MKKLFPVFFLLLLVSSSFAQDKQDALASYRTGRSFETSGQIELANNSYSSAVTICQNEISQNPRNIESYVVLGWSLLRLNNYQETIKISLEALKFSPKEFRIIETLGEAYFYIDKFSDSLKMFEQYVNGLPNGERISSAYFFIGEIYRMTHKYQHAEIAYSTALLKEPKIALWWYRLGRAREDSGNKIGAKEAYEQALKLKPIYQEVTNALKRVS